MVDFGESDKMVKIKGKWINHIYIYIYIYA